MEQGTAANALGRVLEAAEAASPVESVESVTRELAAVLDATAVAFLIADLSGRGLVRLAYVAPRTRAEAGDGPLESGERRDAGESATTIPFDGGPEEQAIRTQRMQLLEPGRPGAGTGCADEWTVLAPVTERGEAIGLLELVVPEEPASETLAEIAQLAHLLAFVVVANRRHTDLYEWGQRTRPLSLSAEIQHRLLAGPQTCEATAFTLAGWLEPAAAIAGDTFDFSLARNVLHLSITDAMGHGVGAALAATLCVSSLRNTRNAGAALLEQVASANRSLVEHATGRGLEDFVTGLIGRIELGTDELALVNAGHVAPYLAREDQVMSIDLPPDVPLGLFPDAVFRSTKVTLAPGDRVVLVTDGMLERNAAGFDLLGAIAITRALHPREAVRELADRLLEHTGGDLADDATILCVDWHGDHGRARTSVHGADRVRASGRLQ